MDFEDILSQWESSRRQKKDELKKNVKSGKKLNAPSVDAEARPQKTTLTEAKQPQKRQAHPIDVWMRRHGINDKDAEIEAFERQKSLLHRHHAKKLPVDAHIDLHGLVAEEAQTRLEAFVTDCVRLGLRKILIIHGKGNHSEEQPVLQRMTREFIEHDRRLGAFGHPDNKNGGSGATWVLIKQTEKR